MADNQKDSRPELNQGQANLDNDVNVKKNESISDQGNEWAANQGGQDNESILGEKAEKYLKESPDIEDLPEEIDEQEAVKVINENQPENNKMVENNDTENNNDVVEDPDDYVPGYDLGRNKVQ